MGRLGDYAAELRGCESAKTQKTHFKILRKRPKSHESTGEIHEVSILRISLTILPTEFGRDPSAHPVSASPGEAIGK